MEANIKDSVQEIVRDTTGKIQSEIKEVKDQLASLATSGADTIGKIEIEMKEMREKLGFLTASVEKGTAERQLLGTVKQIRPELALPHILIGLKF